MYGRLQEDVAWTRLQDMQREMENRRRFGPDRERLAIRAVRSLGGLVRHAADSAVRHTPGRRPATQIEAGDGIRDVA